MLTWSEKLSLLTQKGLSWAEVKEMDKGLETEKNEPKAEPKDEPKVEPKDEPKAEPKDEPKVEPKDELTENEKKLLEKIESLETQLKEAQADNTHADNGGSNELTFDEKLDNMFKNYRI